MSSSAPQPSDREIPYDATEVAERVAAQLAATAIARDRAGGTAKAERDSLRASGLLRLSIPSEFGGVGAPWTETLRIVRRLARVDGSLAHLFGFHHLLVATVRLFGDPHQWSQAYLQTARHDWFWGNALNPLDQRTIIREGPTGDHVVQGIKSFCSGARDSDRLILSALDDRRKLIVAVVPSDRAGIRILQDWDNMGQRQTDSGTVVLDDVVVHDDEILRAPGPLGSAFASLRPCLAQLILANVFLGLGEGALEEARRYTREHSRPWPSSGVAAASDDPYVLRHYGELWLGLHGAATLTDVAGSAFDEAWSRAEALTADTRGACAVAIAAAKVATTRAGLDVANRMFEVAGARATTTKADLDRFWRNLRTHTLHDPVDYKLHELGRFALLGELPTPSFYS